MNVGNAHGAGRSSAWLITVSILSGASAAMAQVSPDVTSLRAELEAVRQEYSTRIAALEVRLAQLEAPTGTPAPAPIAALDAAATPSERVAPLAAPAPGGQPGTYFNPAISMIGNFLAVGGSNSVENLPSSELRESEMGLQAIVDPYARADFFVALGEEGVEMEEGVITFTALPADFLAKAGRMRVLFGKVNSQHLDVLPWPDQPLPVVNLLGGDEGWVGTGVSIGKLLPLPHDTFSEATLQIFRGEAEGLFAGERRKDLAYNGHYRVFRDLTEATNLDLGLSYARGPNDTAPGAQTRLAALDLTYRWRPLRQGTYRGFILRGEVFRSRREQQEATESATGWFASGDYRLAKRWFTGLRYEASERAADARLRDTGQAWTLTFWPSEFTQLRSELRRRDYAEEITATELLLQLQFSIGAHGAHPF